MNNSVDTNDDVDDVEPEPWAVVVSVRNSASVIGEQLAALGRQTARDRLEIVVVDDASTDSTARVVDEWIASNPDIRCRLIRRIRRGGPNASRNDGVAATTARQVMFCDGDDIVADDWAEQLGGRCTHDRVICTGTCVPFDHRPGDSPVVLPPVHTWAGVRYVYGGNAAFSRTLLESLGGFDTDIRSGGTEVGICMRAHRAGATVTPVPAAVVNYRCRLPFRQLLIRTMAKEQGRALLRRRHPTGQPGPLRDLWRDVARCGWHIVRHKPATARQFSLAGARAVAATFWTLRYGLRSAPGR